MIKKFLSMIAVVFLLFPLTANAAEKNWDVYYIDGLSVSGIYPGIIDDIPCESIKTTVEPSRKPLILDMDFCTDVDDACALRMAINMHRKELIDLKCVSLCTNDEYGMNVTAVDGMFDYFGLSIPIGQGPIYIEDESPYWDILSEYSDGNYELIDSVKLWRKIISENDKTWIVTTGYLNNLKAFCESGPDEYSDLTGLELLNKTNIYIVGGSYPHGLDNNFSYEQSAKESSDYVAANINEKIVWITNDVGGPILCGGALQNENPEDQLSRALFAFGTSNGRAAWDPSGVYIAVFGENTEGFSSTSMDITIINGESNIVDSENGKHLRVFRTSEDYEWYQNLFDEYMLP